MEETTFAYQTQQNKSKAIKQAVIVGVVVIVVIIGLLYSRQPKKLETEKAAVVATGAPTLTPTPKIEKSAVKIQVLNGTGTAGQAGVVVKALEDAGYTLANILSDNANTFDHTQTTITFKANLGDIANDIKSTLSSTFENVTLDATNLGASDQFDVIITTGGKTFASETPTVTPTGSESPTSTPTATPTVTVTASPTPTP